MKRIAAVLCFVIVLSFGLVGCGDQYADSKYLGTWVAGTCEYSGMEMDTTSIVGECSLTLEANGKCKIVMAGDDASGKWEEMDNGVKLKNTISIGSDESLELTDNEGVLDMEYSGITIHFEKQS